MAEEQKPDQRRIDCVLIAGGKYHDIDFARLELLKLLAEDERVRTRVFEDFECVEAIAACDLLVSYTCDVTPSLQAQEAIRAFVAGGGRYYALHGTNSILRFLENGLVDTPDWAPHFMETLGSAFASHPPIEPFRIEIADATHPVSAGIEPFETTDELYLSRPRADLHVLLDTEFGGETPGFVDSTWARARHPVVYLRPLGDGAVLYNALGHCRGHYDLQPLSDWWPTVDRCSWELDVYYELLRRGLDWAKAPAIQRMKGE
ncbi:ThuA domain-containing protein [Sphingomonas sp. 3P27F8]|uniref:ThuA domain-containing protein n=1 Tax=Sphingomonas sp. 3P27F8 TaxID=2502213 RepID=UPI0010F6D0D4|nr:ThuA domain-containing protein [Sphingomonas sp. 3P27F8]